MRILGQLIDNAAERKWQSLGQYAEYVDGTKGVGHNKGLKKSRKQAAKDLNKWFNTPVGETRVVKSDALPPTAILPVHYNV